MVRRRNLVHLGWTAVLLLTSQCLAATDLKPVFNHWVENSEDNFPKAINNEKMPEYYVEKIAKPAGDRTFATVNPFSTTALRAVFNIVSDITLDFNYWFHQTKEISSDIDDVTDRNYFVSSKSSADFAKKSLKGSADFIDKFNLKSFDDFTYAFKDIQGKFVIEKAFDGKHDQLTLATPPISLFAEKDNGPNKDKTIQTMQCFTLKGLILNPPVAPATASDPKLLKETKLDLFISLGQEGQEGLIFLDKWTVGDTKQFCPYDYFLLNTVRSQLLIAADKKSMEILKLMTPIGELTRSELSLPSVRAPLGDITPAAPDTHTQWFFFNPIYKYPIEITGDLKGEDVSVCDVAANCFRIEIVDKKGDLDEKVKQLLGNTPFIRFSYPTDRLPAEALKIKFVEDHLDNQVKLAILKRRLELNEPNPTGFVQNVHKNMTIPLGMFDARFMQADGFVKCTAAVQITKAYIGEVVLDLSFLPKTKTPHFKIEDFFFAEKTQIKKLPDVILTVVTDAAKGASCSVDKDKTKITFNPTNAMKSFIHSYTETTMKLNDEQSEALIITDWIHFNHETSFHDNTFTVSLIVTSAEKITETMKKEMKIKRFILGDGFYDVSNDLNGPTIKFEGEKIIITEDAQVLPQIPIGSAARLGYFIQLPKHLPDLEPKPVTFDMSDDDDSVSFSLVDENDQIAPQVNQDQENSTTPVAPTTNATNAPAITNAPIITNAPTTIDTPRANAYTWAGTITIQPLDVKRQCMDNSFAHQDSCQYEESKCLSTFDGKSGSCLMTKSYENHLELCNAETSCLNFLSKPISKSNIAARGSLPDNNGRIFFPLSGVNGEEKPSVRFPLAESNDHDRCITFRYFSASKAVLTLSLDGSETILKYQPLTETLPEKKTKPKKSEPIEICASIFTPHPEKINGFTFMFDGEDKEFENINDHYVALEDYSHPEPAMPANYFKVSESIFDNNIHIFSEMTDKDGKINRLTPAITNLQFSENSTFTTKWIENKNNKLQYELKFQLEADATLSYSARIIGENHQYRTEEVVLTQFKPDDKFVAIHSNELLLSEAITFFKVEFTFYPNKKPVKLTEVYFNDPCRSGSEYVCEQGNLIDPGNDKNLKPMERKDYNQCTCNCNSHFKPGRCDVRDYCAENMCKSKEKCESFPDLLSYKCNDCPEGQIWDMKRKICITAKTECPANQVLLVDENNNIECDCDKNFFYNETSKDCVKFDVCVPEHRLSSKVPADKNGKKIIDCPHTSSHCEPVGDQTVIDPNAYKCVCNEEYFNQNGISTPGHTKCLLSNVTLDVQTCSQGFNPRNNRCNCNSGYKFNENGVCVAEEATQKIIDGLKDNKICVSNHPHIQPYYDIRGKKCACQPNFQWNDTIFECEPIQNADFFKNNFNLCDNIEIDQDGKLRCVCDETKNKILDEVTRVCKDDFSKEDLECKKHNSVYNKQTKECDCDIMNQIKYQKADDDVWKCVDKCVAIEVIAGGAYSCSQAFSHCLKKNVVFDLLGKKIFVEGNDTLVSSNALERDDSHCKCDEGFENPNQPICLQKEDLTQIKLTIDMIKGAATPDQISHYLESILVEIFTVKKVNEAKTETKISAVNAECPSDETNSEFVTCKASFTANKIGGTQINEGMIKKLIVDKSIPLGNYRGYVMPKQNRFRRSADSVEQQRTMLAMPKPNVKDVLILFNGDSVQADKVNFCDKNPCKQYVNSECQEIPDSNSLVECRCNAKSMFTKSKDPTKPSRPSQRIAGKNVVYESCEPMDLCNKEGYKCVEDPKIAECHNIMITNGTGPGTVSTPDVLCTCRKTGVRLLSRLNRCNECDDCNAEGIIGCGAVPGKPGLCKCKDDYNGDKCQHKIGAKDGSVDPPKPGNGGDDSKVSKAYVYTTIAAGIVAALAIVGVCVLFYRRR